MKRIAILLLTLVILIAFAGCTCKHVWREATCTEPKTCNLCGITEGTATGHNYVKATCTEPKTCNLCGSTEGTATGHNYVNGYCEECGAEDPNYVNPNLIGFQNNYNMNKWLEIRGYDQSKNTVFTTVAGIEKFACRIFSNGYVYFDWRDSDGIPNNSGSQPVAYTCADNNNILLSDGCSYNITDRVVIGNAVIIKTMYYRVSKSDMELWFVPYDMIDWSKGTYIDEENRICYTLKN